MPPKKFIEPYFDLFRIMPISVVPNFLMKTAAGIFSVGPAEADADGEGEGLDDIEAGEADSVGVAI